ncbi:MAG: cold shock domain-containing protein [Gammaproteobacteria bacterium]|nr:cold shock domain-containing protein [Gammaproteobacteria bacterium]MYF02636.1 cold shock domain-containing protein [Gammaproteobacteria bacterium]MYI76333.1 cold shock domain-containing protein [Gammaproteobacteria bacterium]
MSKRVLLLLAIIGSALFWAALISEISFRYVDMSGSGDSLEAALDIKEESEGLPPSATRNGFLVLFALVSLAVASSSFLTYQIAKRNLLTTPSSNKVTNRRQTKRQSQGSKTSFKTTQERTGHKKVSKLPKNKNTAPSKQSVRTGRAPNTVDPSSSSKGPAISGERVKGRVRVYYTRRSYGFVEDESKQTIFFHKSAVDQDINERDLTKKPSVSYIVTPSDRGPIATDIQLEQ